MMKFIILMVLISMNKNDMKLVIILISVSLCFLFFCKIIKKDNNYAYVYYENKIIKEIDLTKDDEYSVTGYNGDVLIEVKNGMIRVKKENSPLNICSKQGFVKDMPIICLPNKIVIKLGNNELDSVTS